MTETKKPETKAKTEVKVKAKNVGRVKSYRRGINTQHNNQLIIHLNESRNKLQALKFIGKKVTWETPSGRKITGKITACHGSAGALRARFVKGLPGIVLGSKVDIY